ncbi:hypothetical protein Bca101_023381 [Brassica carinata]
MARGEIRVDEEVRKQSLAGNRDPPRIFCCPDSPILQLEEDDQEMATSKKVITRDEWEKKLNAVKLRKEDMNTLVMNFLVTEGFVEAADKFQRESGTKRTWCVWSTVQWCRLQGMLCSLCGCRES